MRRWIVFLSVLFVLLALSAVLIILNPSLAEVTPSENSLQNTGVFAILQDYGDMFFVDVYDASGEPFQMGAALDTRSVVLDELPDLLIFELDGDCELTFERVSP